MNYEHNTQGEQQNGVLGAIAAACFAGILFAGLLIAVDPIALAVAGIGAMQ